MSLRLNSVSMSFFCALGPDFSSNAVSYVLDGMDDASNNKFKTICATNSNILGNKLYRQIFQSFTPQAHLFRFLYDLKKKYNECFEAKQ